MQVFNELGHRSQLVQDTRAVVKEMMLENEARTAENRLDK